MSERDELTVAVERLRVITDALRDPDVPLAGKKDLAEEALARSAEITERLPRLIREIEDVTGSARVRGDNSEDDVAPDA
jgi:hypothetical protein